MTSTTQTNAEARVVRLEELSWIEAPGHHGALSKLLVNPENAATKHFDFRISVYAPKGHVEQHTHETTEQVYYILSGKGLMTLGERRVVVEPHTAIYIPPRVLHSIENTGLEDLVFVVVSAPPQEMSRVDTRAQG
ncbi:cupin domain-containing protein [bacterium]|nr:MAG: cupin domain-containing protein [bacterium]